MPSDHERFMSAFIGAEPKLRAYAHSCGLSVDQIDDLVQEAALVLWRRFGEYDAARPFIAWALGVAHRLIQETWRSRSKSRLLAPDVAESLARTCGEVSSELDRRREALRRCVERLPEGQRSLIRSRYSERMPLSDVARRLRKGLSAVNMALHRIRLALLRCVEQEART